jgi:CelD/BcsL family acetyltransferase involved in cellulose biosynthesis
MNIRVFSDLADPELGSTWRQLEDAGACPCLFASHTWVTAWALEFAHNSTPKVVVGYEGEGPVGLAPLFVTGRGTVELPVNFLSHRGEFLLSGDAAEAFAGEVLRHFRAQRRRLVLRSVPTASPTYAAVVSASASAGYRAHTRPGRVSPYLDITTTWDGYLASRPSKRTSRWAKQNRKFRELGDVSVESAGGVNDVDRLVDLFVDVESRSWKERDGSTIRGRGLEGFYRDLGRALAEQGWLRSFWLVLDGQAVAFILGVVFHGTFVALKTAYDESYAKQSPGMVLFHDVIADAFERGLSQVDFLGEPSRWKREWATGEREHATVTLYPTTPPGLAGYLADAVLKPLARRLRRGR